VALTTASPVGPLLLLAGVVGLVIFRPLGLSEAWPAALGALLALLFRWAAPADVLAAIQDTYGVLLFLLAMTLLSGLADHAGVFRWLAAWTLRTARGRGWLLLVNLYLLGALITLFLSLDVTAVVLTPLACALVLGLRLDARPFILTCAFVANTASLALPMSNLTNMLVYGLLHVSFWSFVRYLALPNLAAMAVNLVLFVWFFWGRLPADVALPEGAHLPLPPSAYFRWGLALLGLSAAGLTAAGMLGLPFWPVVLPLALLFAGLACRRRWIALHAAAGMVAWTLPPFVVAMYVVVAAVYRALGPLVAQLPGAAAQAGTAATLLVTTASTAAGANVVNNLPLSLAAIQFLQDVPAGLAAGGSTGGSAGALPVRDVLAYGTLLGVNLGPNLTVTGSLATMLVLGIARRQGIVITPWQFARTGLVVGPVMLLTAAVVLLLLIR
jgi:arsenical pump membrane protein